jgi:Holliday junction DNA helicase RuvA
VIASISGIVKLLRINTMVVEVSGVGMLVHVSPRLSANQTVGRSVSLHTVLVVREDALTLYGFETPDARDLFEILQTVTGIGPKVAQSALTVYDVPELVSAIKSENSSILEKIPGLGKKGAQRLVLELKEKLGAFVSTQSPVVGAWREQLNSALVGLGYSLRQSEERIETVAAQFGSASEIPIAELLRAALSTGPSR